MTEELSSREDAVAAWSNEAGRDEEDDSEENLSLDELNDAHNSDDHGNDP